MPDDRALRAMDVRDGGPTGQPSGTVVGHLPADLPDDGHPRFADELKGRERKGRERGRRGGSSRWRGRGREGERRGR